MRALNSDRPRHSDRTVFCAACLFLATCVMSCLSACSSRPDLGDKAAAARSHLAERAAMEQSGEGSPSLESNVEHFLPAIPALGLTATSAAGQPGSQQTLEQIVEANTIPQPDQGMDASAAPESAVRLYVSGRSRLAHGDTRGAIEDLRAAARMDPDAAKVWAALGEAQLTAGSTSGALASLQRAVDRGSRDPVVLIRLGLGRLEQGDSERALAPLATCRRSLGRREIDVEAWAVVHSSLARVLSEQGHEQAALEAQQESLAAAERLTTTRQFHAQIRTILRGGSDTWVSVGDAACQLGRYEDALAAYERIPEQEAVPLLLTRKVYVLLKLGRPATAALLVPAGHKA